MGDFLSVLLLRLRSVGWRCSSMARLKPCSRHRRPFLYNWRDPCDQDVDRLVNGRTKMRARIQAKCTQVDLVVPPSVLTRNRPPVVSKALVTRWTDPQAPFTTTQGAPARYHPGFLFAGPLNRDSTNPCVGRRFRFPLKLSSLTVLVYTLYVAPAAGVPSPHGVCPPGSQVCRQGLEPRREERGVLRASR